MNKYLNKLKRRKLVSINETSISYLQIFGIFLVFFGIISVISAAFIESPAGISISFFITMLGFAFVFPSLLEGNDGLSTMRIVVFMMTNVICMLLLKIGWAATTESLSDIGLDEWWMGVIAFVFGAKAMQSYFESKMAVTREIPKAGMAAVQFSNAEIAKLAVEQNKHFLKAKFPNIVSVSDAVHDLSSTESHVVALYLKDNNTVGIPDKLEVKMPGGVIKTIATEIIKGVGTGKIQINQTDEIRNGESYGSVCCIIETDDGNKKVVTAGHVYSKGDSTNYHGELSLKEQSPAQINKSVIGNWFFQMINSKTDVALSSIDHWQEDSKCISFKNKEHYEVKDSDVAKRTRVIMISNINRPKEREAFILDYNTEWDVEYDDKTLAKNKIIVIGAKSDRGDSVSVSSKGDSGGCVYEPTTGNLVGLILGGNEKFTWVLSLKEVFEEFNYKLI